MVVRGPHGVQGEPARGPLAPHGTVAPRAPTAPLDTTHTTPKPASIQEGSRVVGCRSGADPEHTSPYRQLRRDMHEHERGGQAVRNGTRRQLLQRRIALDTEEVTPFNSAVSFRAAPTALVMSRGSKSTSICLSTTRPREHKQLRSRMLPYVTLLIKRIVNSGNKTARRI